MYQTGVIKRSTVSIVVVHLGNAIDVIASVVMAIMLLELLLKPASISEFHLRISAVRTKTTKAKTITIITIIIIITSTKIITIIMCQLVCFQSYYILLMHGL